MKKIQTSMQLREEHQCLSMNMDEFKEVARLFAFINCGHRDKQGRPIFYVLLRNFNLKNISEDLFKRYFVFLTDQACASMPVRVDQFILVLDAFNFGYSQMFTNHIKQMLSFQRSIHMGRGYCTIVLRGNMVFKSI